MKDGEKNGEGEGEGEGEEDGVERERDRQGRGLDRKERERGNLPEEHLFFNVKEAKLLRIEPLPQEHASPRGCHGDQVCNGESFRLKF